MRIDLKNYPNYHRYSGLFLVLVGMVLLLPRMINGGDAGPGPMIGILFIIVGARYFRKGTIGRGKANS